MNANGQTTFLFFQRPSVTADTYFASGSNHSGEIAGFAEVGRDLGVAVERINQAALYELQQLAGTDIRVFVDSGAFGEVRFGDAGLYVHKPITDQMWRKRLAAMLKIARALGPNAYIVAPDMVGHQSETLDRLRTYSDEVRAIHATGARIIVPLQKGAMSMARFEVAAGEVLGFTDFIAGIPMKKDATTPDDLRRYLTEGNPRALHLLGMGPTSPKFEATTQAIADTAPHLPFTCDSVLICAKAGRTNGPGGGPRVLTWATDLVTADIARNTYGGGCNDNTGLPDFTDCVMEPGFWTGKAERERIADRAMLRGTDRAAFISNPDTWIAQNDVSAWLYEALKASWGRWYSDRGCTHEVKRRTVAAVFGPTEVETDDNVSADQEAA